MSRREQVVGPAGLALLVLQAVPLVAVGWVSDGGRAAADGLLVGLTSPVLFAVAAFGAVLAVAVRRQPPMRMLDRLRWAAGAALAHVGALAVALVLDGAAASGAAGLRASMDDGSLEWSVVAMLLRAVVIDLRAPLAFLVALVALQVGARHRPSLSSESPSPSTTPSPSPAPSPAQDRLSGGSGPGRGRGW